MLYIYKFKDSLAEDFLYSVRRARNDPTIEMNNDFHLMALISITKIIADEGYEIRDYPYLPQITEDDYNRITVRYQQHLDNDDLTQEVINNAINTLQNNLHRLNPEQRVVYDTVVNNNDPSKLFCNFKK